MVNRERNPKHVAKNASRVVKSLLVIWSIVGGQVENIDCDECMDTDIQTASDILALQFRRVIQEKRQKTNKCNTWRLWHSTER